VAKLRSRISLASVLVALGLCLSPIAKPAAAELAEGQLVKDPGAPGLVVFAQEEPAPGEAEAPTDQAEGEPPAAEPEPEAPPPASAEPAAVLSEPGGVEAPPPEAEPEAAPSEPGPAAPAPPAEAPVTVDGQGTQVSRPFNLRGGEYAVSWSATTSNPECAFSATLHASATSRPVQPLGSAQIFGGGGSGQSSLHDLPGASYYVDAITTCRWSITITPAQ
jgi:hypothetical protein